MRRFRAIWGLAAIMLSTACGSRVELDSSGVTMQPSQTSAAGPANSTVAIDEAAAGTAIRALFAEVLNGANVANIEFEAARIEGGTDPAMTPILVANGANAIAQTLSTTVDSVSFPSAEDCDLAGEKVPCAEVIYTVASNGQVLLPAQKGFSVQQDDKWVMSRNTFCGLAELSGGPACP